MNMIGLAYSIIGAALGLLASQARKREQEQMAKIRYLEEAQEREEEKRERRRLPRPAATAAPITWTQEEPERKAPQAYMDFPEGRLPPEAANMTEQMRQTLARKLGAASEETKRIVAEYMAAQGRA